MILKKISDGRRYQINDLAHDLGISPRMVRYIIDDINYFLKSIDIQRISIHRNEGVQLFISDNEKDILLHKIARLDNYAYTINATERKNYILLSMWCSNEPLTSQYFADVLNVSKSSIDKDILSIRQMVKDYDFAILVKSGKGSYIEGDEREIRTCFFQIIEKNIDFNKLIHISQQPYSFIEKSIYTFVFEKYLTNIMLWLETLESQNEKKLTYLSYKDICIHLCISLTRIALNHTIDLHSQYIQEIKKTEGYKEACYLSQEIKKEFSLCMSESEMAFIAVLLNGARFTITKRYIIHDWVNMQMIATSLVNRVGKELGIDFSDDEELINSLTLHLGPTLFKLQNQVPVVNPSLAFVKRNYHDVFIALTHAIKELDYADLKKISEDDIAFLTLHFCASLERRKRVKATYNVIIVCVYGVGTATLMKEMICTRFKNILVKKIVTRNNLLGIDLTNIDFIISSIDLEETICPIIKVNAILKEKDYELIQSTMQNIIPDTNEEVFMNKVLDIVNSHCEIIDKKELIHHLTDYFNELGVNISLKRQPNLDDYLTKDKIMICETIPSWQQAVKMVGTILKDAGDIKDEYIESMLQTILEIGSYMIIDQGVALVHGEMNQGVKNVAMSLLLIKNGVYFEKEKNPIHLILCLAAKDNYTHVKALSHFLKLLKRFQLVDQSLFYDQDYVLNQIREVSKDD